MQSSILNLCLLCIKVGQESIHRGDHFLMVKCDYMDKGGIRGRLANVIHKQ